MTVQKVVHNIKPQSFGNLSKQSIDVKIKKKWFNNSLVSYQKNKRKSSKQFLLRDGV